jgi:hypothetical protein
MNLFEFQQRINYIVESQQSRNRNPEDIRVCIPIKTPSAIGGTPCIDVESVHLGFDWDNNKLMLYPTEDLSRSDHDYLANIRKQAEELGWSVYEMGNLKREIKHLKKLLKEKENE